MEEMTEQGWMEVLHLTCLIVGEFAVAVSHAVDYTPETLQEVIEAVAEAEQGKAHAESGAEVVNTLLTGKVTARSDKSFEMLATMLDITEWNYSYMTRHITPTEELEEKYFMAKRMIQATASC